MKIRESEQFLLNLSLSSFFFMKKVLLYFLGGHLHYHKKILKTMEDIKSSNSFHLLLLSVNYVLSGLDVVDVLASA